MLVLGGKKIVGMVENYVSLEIDVLFKFCDHSGNLSK